MFLLLTPLRNHRTSVDHGIYYKIYIREKHCQTDAPDRKRLSWAETTESAARRKRTRATWQGTAGVTRRDSGYVVKRRFRQRALRHLRSSDRATVAGLSAEHVYLRSFSQSLRPKSLAMSQGHSLNASPFPFLVQHSVANSTSSSTRRHLVETVTCLCPQGSTTPVPGR